MKEKYVFSLDTQKLIEYIVSRSALKEILKKALQVEGM